MWLGWSTTPQCNNVTCIVISFTVINLCNTLQKLRQIFCLKVCFLVTAIVVSESSNLLTFMFDKCAIYVRINNQKQARITCIGNTKSKSVQLTTQCLHTCFEVSNLMPQIFALWGKCLKNENSSSNTDWPTFFSGFIFTSASMSEKSGASLLDFSSLARFMRLFLQVVWILIDSTYVLHIQLNGVLRCFHY